MGPDPKTVTGKHNRFGRRNTAGRIELAAGVNLAPLINRAADLNACFAAQQLQADQLKQSRQHASELISQIRSLGADEALDTARAALPRLRPSEIKDLRRLDVIIAGLTAVLSDFCESPGRKIETAQSEDLDRPYTKTNMNTKTCTKAENQERVNQPMRTTPQQVLLLASSTFAQMIEFYQDGMAPNGTLTWEIISHAARELAQSHGITGADWANNAAQLGQARSALCILLADRNALRTDHYQVRNVPAAFLGMVRKEAQGKAIIETLVAELTSL